jgi:hypothetical protein
VVLKISIRADFQLLSFASKTQAKAFVTAASCRLKQRSGY